MCNLTWSRLAAFHCSRSVLQKEISVSSSHIHQHISHVHYVVYRRLSLMDIMCTCTCAMHCVCVNIWCFIYLLPHFCIFKHFSPTWCSDAWYNETPALILSAYVQHRTDHLSLFVFWTLLCIITEVVQKLFHSAFSRKIEHDWFWFHQRFMGRLSTSVKIPRSFQNKCFCSVSENRNASCKTVSIVSANLERNAAFMHMWTGQNLYRLYF